MTASIPAVAELQGLYGPFAFPELLLQKLWWRREFASTGACTADGRRVTVVSPGRWNRLGGPDFRGATLEIDGVRQRGDVEVHLRAEDWGAHGHAADPAYDNVILHVVLFPPRRGVTRGARGQEIPVLALLPLLWHDLEEYATDEAIAALLNRAEHRIAAELAPLPPAVLLTLLYKGAQQRWAEKVRFARRRIDRLGWEEACHHTALEILGYRANRAGMLRVAGEWSFESWSNARADPDAIFEASKDLWTFQGVRPANHPRHRLRQYAAWTRERPDWPRRLAHREHRSTAAAEGDESVAEARLRLGFPKAWDELRTEVCAGAVSGPRADNLVGDGVLPLLAANESLPSAIAFDWWWCGYPGDLPDPIRRALRELAVSGTRQAPLAIGPAQGLIGWLLQREAQEAREASHVRQGA